MNKGFLAGVCLKKDKTKNDKAFQTQGYFIEDLDYFEKTKKDLMKEFSKVKLDEDFFVSAHRHELM